MPVGVFDQRASSRPYRRALETPIKFISLSRIYCIKIWITSEEEERKREGGGERGGTCPHVQSLLEPLIIPRMTKSIGPRRNRRVLHERRWKPGERRAWMAFLNVWTVTYVELRAITRVPSYLTAGVVGTYIQINAFVSSGWRGWDESQSEWHDNRGRLSLPTALSNTPGLRVSQWDAVPKPPFPEAIYANTDGSLQINFFYGKIK